MSTVVCLGSGPSLTQADVDYVRGRARVIAVNDAIRLAPWADVLYACDGKWWSQHHASLHQFKGMRFSLTVNRKRFPDVQRLRNAGVDGACLEPGSVKTGRNSGYQAIQLAVHIGASRVLLLGYDMMRHGGKSHFFGEHPNKWTPSPYRSFLQVFPSIVKPLAKYGVEVINCSRVTALDCFPKMTIEDALPAQDLAVSA